MALAFSGQLVKKWPLIPVFIHVLDTTPACLCWTVSGAELLTRSIQDGQQVTLSHQPTLGSAGCSAGCRADTVLWWLTRASSLNPSNCDADTTVIIPSHRGGHGGPAGLPVTSHTAGRGQSPDSLRSVQLDSRLPSIPPWLSASPVMENNGSVKAGVS